MYEQYLRDPTSVGEEWRQLFDNGRLAELPVIPTTRAEVTAQGGPRGAAGAGAPKAPPASAPASTATPGLTPLTGAAAPLARNMTHPPPFPTPTSSPDIPPT